MKRHVVAAMLFVPMVIFTFVASVMATGVEPVATKDGLPTTYFDVRASACPIMGGPPQAKVATVYQGKVYHFCCDGCIADFHRDPKTAIEKLSEAKEVPLTITNPDRLCPITGKPSSESIFLVRGEFITFYCCPDCVGKDPLPEKKTGAVFPPSAAGNSQAPLSNEGSCH